MQGAIQRLVRLAMSLLVWEAVVLHHLLFALAVVAKIDFEFVEQESLVAWRQALRDRVTKIVDVTHHRFVLFIKSNIPKIRKVFGSA